MIEFIHKYPILIKILLTITTVAFVGTGGYFLGQETVQYAATVEDEKITVDQLQKEVYRLEDFYKQIYQGNVPENIFKNLNLTKMALDQLIERRVILISADRMGLGVGDEEIADAVRNNQSFRDEQGNFSKDVYTQVLKFNNMTPKEYEQALRDELLMDKFRNLLKDSVVVTEQDVRRYFMEQRKAQGLEFDEKAFEENKERLWPSVENEMKLMVIKSTLDNLRAQLKVEIEPGVIPPAE